MTCIAYNNRIYHLSTRTLPSGEKVLLLNDVEESKYPQNIRDYARMRAEHAGLI